MEILECFFGIVLLRTTIIKLPIDDIDMIRAVVVSGLPVLGIVVVWVTVLDVMYTITITCR